MGLVSDYDSGSKYFKAIDIVGGEVIMTIIAVVETTYPANDFGPERTEPALQFSETDKIFGLVNVNRKSLATLFGVPNEKGLLDVDSEALLGQQIALYKDIAQTKQGPKECVRIRAPRVPNAAPARAALPPAQLRQAQPAAQRAPAAPGRQPVPRQGAVPSRPQSVPRQQPPPQQQQGDGYPEPGSYDGDDLSNPPDGM